MWLINFPLFINPCFSSPVYLQTLILSTFSDRQGPPGKARGLDRSHP